MVSSAQQQFTILQKQLNTELRTLLTESKRRSSEVKHATEKSLEILKTCHTSSDLKRHPDFILPLIKACGSKSAKLTTIAMQCLQRMAAVDCIPEQRIPEVLDAFTDASLLASEIQLKVLQIVPIFFKTNGKLIYGPLCSKLLKCCSNLLQIPNKSPIVIGTASATMQQLIDEIFDRLNIEWDSSDRDHNLALQETHEVLISNSETIKVNAYRYDAHVLFSNLSSLAEKKDSTSASNNGTKNATQSDETAESNMVMLNVDIVSTDYGLEILESVLENSFTAFLKYQDLQFILRTKMIPFVLRCISSSNSKFPIVVRSYRCINLLIRTEFLKTLHLELEVILSLLIFNLTPEGKTPLWKKILSLELFNNILENINTIEAIYMTYDDSPDRKDILRSLTTELYNIIQSSELSITLHETKIIHTLDNPQITMANSIAKSPFMQMLDKTNPTSTNQNYFLFLAQSIVKNMSAQFSNAASNVALEDLADKEKRDNLDLTKAYRGLFPSLFDICKKLLYCASFESQIFNSLVRSFQKLSHAGGILLQEEELNKCLELFSLSIVRNCLITDMHIEEQNTKHEEQTSTTDTVLNALSETLIGNQSPKTPHSTTKGKMLHPRVFSSKHISLFRALISLAISLGEHFSYDSWNYIFVTWQWVSYFLLGPSADFLENIYVQDIPAAPKLSKADNTMIERSITQLYESTASYPASSLKSFLETIVEESKQTFQTAQNYEDERANDFYHAIINDKVRNCIYNKTFFVSQLGHLSTNNCTRFISGDLGKENWLIIMDYLKELIGDRQLGSQSLRLYVTSIFTDLIRRISNSVATLEDQNLKTNTFGSLELLVANSLLDTITTIKNLKVGEEEINHGISNIEADILFQLLSTLKEILNEFGDLLSHSWKIVFDIINGPFEWLNESKNILSIQDNDNSSLINAFIQRYRELIQVSYDVFKLISDDFLQTLPINTIKCVIDTIVNFVNQDRNLNISFSSISQFWLIGDYLRNWYTSQDTKETLNEMKDFSEKVKSGKLLETIGDNNSSFFEMYNGLWLFLLSNLVNCTKDARIEVKNGAIQTFFRILDSHSEFLPDWELIFEEVFKPFLLRRPFDEDLTESVDFLDVSLGGLSSLYPQKFNDFENNSNTSEKWLIFLDLLKHLLDSESSSIEFIAISKYNMLLSALLSMTNVTDDVLDKCFEVWSDYSIIYNDITTPASNFNKSGYDCINELILAFPNLYTLLEKYNKITEDVVEKVLTLLNAAVRYPLLPEHSRDNIKPSSLQGAILSCLDTFSSTLPVDTQSLIFVQLSTIINLSFETRKKIEKKLLPKLPLSARSRIPTFEAISYGACEQLSEMLAFSKRENKILFKGQHIIRLMQNLGDVIERKSLITLDSSKNLPLWEFCSQCFEILTEQLLVCYKEEKIDKKIMNEFCDLFVKVAVSPLNRINKEIDEQTEEVDLKKFKVYRDLLLDTNLIELLNNDQMNTFISSAWSNSFFYQLDDVENSLLSSCSSLSEISEKFSEISFDDTIGSTVQPPLLTKYKCSKMCLNNVIEFASFEEKKTKQLRNIVVPYLVSRISFALRRFISDQPLLKKAPFPKIRRLELVILLKGVGKIVSKLNNQSTNEDEQIILQNFKHLYPLIVRTIPIAHTIPEIQPFVLQLSLDFTRLTPS